jgi:phosphosulfolactate phosphohydrolase-like enzyme
MEKFFRDSNLGVEIESEVENFIFVKRKEEIPDSFSADQIVVVDSIYYSTTVVELLYHGVDKVHVVEEKLETLEMKKENPELLAGGFRDSKYEPMKEWDFFNSPTYAEKVAEPGKEAAMTSSNGAKAALRAREANDSADILLAGLTNFHAVADRLHQDDEILFISSGRKGDIAIEDHAGIYSVLLHLLNDGPGDTGKKEILDAVEKGKLETYSSYVDIHERRARDIEKVKDLKSREVVPKLVDGAFKDVPGE